MRSPLLLVALLWIIPALKAQKVTPLFEMVSSEKSFAATASSVGIQEAFLKYLDDSAVVFEQGKISNGKEVWKNRKTEGASLIWYPEFAEVAQSGDFGYTTGPAQFRAVKGSEKADYIGHFNSIWRKNASGEWKVLLDIGTPSASSDYDENKVEYSLAETKSSRAKKSSADITALEKKFIEANANGKAYATYGSANARYYRPRKNVVRGNDILGDTTALEFRNAGSGMASSGDLGFAYGYVTASASQGNYLRVWKKEKNEWKIVLDVVNY